jgi:hypothetical protein
MAVGGLYFPNWRGKDMYSRLVAKKRTRSARELRGRALLREENGLGAEVAW